MREFKIRYKQTALGAAWAIVQPLALMLVFSLIFSGVASITDAYEGIDYRAVAYLGLVFWTLFATSVTFASNSLVNNQALVTKSALPRIILVMSSVFVGVIDFLIAAALFFVLALVLDVPVEMKGVLLLLPLMLVTLLTAAGVSTFLSALNVKYRDVRYALPFAVQLLLFLTPVIYPTSIVSESYQWILYLNPMTAVVEAARCSMFGAAHPEIEYLAISALSLLAILITGFAYFRRSEKEFADLI